MEKKPDSQKQSWLKKSVLAAGTLLIAGGLLLGPSLLAENGETSAQSADDTAVFSVRTQEAQRQNLHAFLDVNGEIVSARQAEVFPEAAGRLVAVHAALGSYVRAGDIIAEVDPSRPGADFMNSPVIAPISGIVSRTPLSVGMTVGPNSSITVISANGNLEISARIPEREVAGLVPGLKAQVSLQAFPGESFAATVTRVSPVLDSASRTKLINLHFDPLPNGAHDPRINAGMFARIRINTHSYSDVLAVPAEALVSGRGADAVYVAGFDAAGLPVAHRREVERGPSHQGWTEIKAGLNEGETVIVQGQQLLSGGERVRIIGGV